MSNEPVLSTLEVTEAPKVKVGFATYAGTVGAILAAVGTVYAAAENQDTATVVGGVASIAALITTIGGRFAQAVVLMRQTALVLDPFIDGLLEEDDQRPEA